jgi:MoxR-like ATPase
MTKGSAVPQPDPPPAVEVPLVYTSVLPPLVDDADLWAASQDGERFADRRDGAIYHLHPRMRLAIDLAIATGRPLLVRGEPGSGKSSLAHYVARNLHARRLEEVVTATTRVEDFLWRFDVVQRLADAQTRRGDAPLDDTKYVRPGVLWRAFDPDGEFGGKDEEDTVVLIDEIDKADPDVPNGLLVPLGSRTFTVRPLNKVITAPAGRRVLVVITTNEERQLPPAFLRRCVVARIPDPTKETLTTIARLHVYGPDGEEPSAADADLFTRLADRLIELRATSGQRERPPGIAEYLDAVKACRALDVDPAQASAAWAVIEEFTLRKPTGES